MAERVKVDKYALRGVQATLHTRDVEHIIQYIHHMRANKTLMPIETFHLRVNSIVA